MEVETMNNRIYEAMVERGLTAYELAKKSHIDKGALSRYLSGKVQPKHDNIHKLAVALNVSETWLMGYDVKRERETEEEQRIGEETLQQEMSRRMQVFFIFFTLFLQFDRQAAVRCCECVANKKGWWSGYR